MIRQKLFNGPARNLSSGIEIPDPFIICLGAVIPAAHIDGHQEREAGWAVQYGDIIISRDGLNCNLQNNRAEKYPTLVKLL